MSLSNEFNAEINVLSVVADENRISSDSHATLTSRTFTRYSQYYHTVSLVRCHMVETWAWGLTAVAIFTQDTSNANSLWRTVRVDERAGLSLKVTCYVHGTGTILALFSYCVSYCRCRRRPCHSTVLVDETAQQMLLDISNPQPVASSSVHHQSTGSPSDVRQHDPFHMWVYFFLYSVFRWNIPNIFTSQNDASSLTLSWFMDPKLCCALQLTCWRRWPATQWQLVSRNKRTAVSSCSGARGRKSSVYQWTSKLYLWEQTKFSLMG